MRMVLNIIKYGETILRKKCKPVRQIGGAERKLFDDMAQTMYNAQGVGLAASQVGLDLQLMVTDDGKGLIRLANPKILRRKGRETFEEGCLSVPEITVRVRRAREITVTGLNENGENISLNIQGLLARIIQHECDHLEGKLIIDYLSFPQKILIKKKLKVIRL